MATELGAAYISVGLSTKGLGGDLKKAFSGADGAGADAGKRAGKGFGMGFARIAASAIGALGIGTFLKGAVSEASGLGESINAVNVVFGKAAKGVQQLGKESATSLGLSNLEFNNLAVRFSSFAQSIAGPGGDVTGTLKDMTGRASDFASVMNLEVSEAAELFQSGLAGESEPLRQYGIDLSAAAVEAFALKEGITKSAGSMTEAEKVQARYGLLMEKTSVTAGDFANTSNSLANQQRILSSSWKNAQATLGTALLPAISAVTGALIKGLDPAVAGTQKVMSEATGGFRALVAAFKEGGNDVTSGGFAGAMERIGLVARSAFEGLKPVVASLSASFGPLIPQVLQLVSSFSPLGLLFKVITPILPMLATAFMQISGAIAGVLAIVIPLATQLVASLVPVIVNLVSTILPPLAAMFGELIAAVAPFVVQLASSLIPMVKALMPVVVTVFNVVSSVIKSAMQIIRGVIQVVTGIISGNWSQVWTGIQNVFGGIWNTIKTIVGGAIRIVGSYISAGLGLASGTVRSTLGNIGRFFADTWNNIVNGVSGMIGRVTGFFSGMGGKIMGALSGAGSWLVGVGQNIVQGLIDGARGMIDRAVAAVKDVGGAMLDGIKGFLGIKSPSRVFKAEVGMMIGAGLIQGLDASQRGVAASVNRLVPIPSVPAYRAGAYSPAGSVSVGAGSGVTINGNVGWDPHQVAQEIEVQKRRSLTMAGMGGVVFA